MAEKNSKPKAQQRELPNMPAPKGVAKIALEWLATQGRIRILETEKKGVVDRILNGMKKEKRQVFKVKDPDTGEISEFKLDEGHEILRVKKIPENVGKNK